MTTTAMMTVMITISWQRLQWGRVWRHRVSVMDDHSDDDKVDDAVGSQISMMIGFGSVADIVVSL